VRRFIDWWIGEDGYAIPERSGKLRWFVRISDTIHWADTPEEIYKTFGRKPEIQPKSVTFIRAKLEDNRIFMQKDPAYLGNLLALSRVDRMRLLEGNWNIRESAGTMFRREWFPIVDAIPAGWVSAIRFWDRAATKPNNQNADPDWTRGLKLYGYPDGSWLVADLRSTRDSPGQVEKLIKNVASHDGQGVRIMSQQDPGSAGVLEAENFIKMLAGYDVRTEVFNKDKINRAKPVSAQCEAGNLKVLRAAWNESFFQELENFPDGNHDDIVDVLSGAFNELAQSYSSFDVL
jgi:predicted phage terminase large subunit-like protein